MCPCGPQILACPRAGQLSSASCPRQMASSRAPWHLRVFMDRPMSTLRCPRVPAAVSHLTYGAPESHCLYVIHLWLCVRLCVLPGRVIP